jgi:hypothetical protein
MNEEQVACLLFCHYGFTIGYHTALGYHMIDVKALFEKHSDEYLKFDRVTDRPYGNRPDVHAFVLLAKLDPSTEDMVSSAEHDQIWLGVDHEAVGDVATEDQIIELIRCGVRFDEEYDCLHMFV